ncbi:LPS-assembly protein LptD [Vulcanococcus limneticus Candia 3F8]|nr:LPS-assembly protein LptD [Vulcanococcus limneticus MW73D5]MCP9893444.1 LPS-assembly protein LptD [Vulcanococcus limneticus Candia 3F8]MCP9896998.1 LPS-assembly protein LptD [Vulcanococcus limneticus Candia 3B3]
MLAPALALLLLPLAAAGARAQGLGSPVSAPVPASPAAAPAPAPAVTPTTGQVTIESDLQRADQVTGVVTATGNVRIVYPDRRVVATSRQAQYFSKEGRVVLSGDVDVIQEGGNHLRAELVTYFVETERVLANPAAGRQVFSTLRIESTPTASPTQPAQPTP